MSKIFHVMYDDDAKVMAAASELVGQGVQVKDVFSPVSYTHLTLPTKA